MTAIAWSTTAETAKVQRCGSGSAACAHAQASGDRGGGELTSDDGIQGAASSSPPGTYTAPRGTASTRNSVRRHRPESTS